MVALGLGSGSAWAGPSAPPTPAARCPALVWCSLPPAAAAAPTPPALGAVVAALQANVTSTRPIIGPGGWLIGDGLNAPADCTGAACNGGDGGFLWGNGADGANGSPGQTGVDGKVGRPGSGG